MVTVAGCAGIRSTPCFVDRADPVPSDVKSASRPTEGSCESPWPNGDGPPTIRAQSDGRAVEMARAARRSRTVRASASSSAADGPTALDHPVGMQRSGDIYQFALARFCYGRRIVEIFGGSWGSSKAAIDPGRPARVETRRCNPRPGQVTGSAIASSALDRECVRYAGARWAGSTVADRHSAGVTAGGPTSSRRYVSGARFGERPLPSPTTTGRGRTGSPRRRGRRRATTGTRRLFRAPRSDLALGASSRGRSRPRRHRGDGRVRPLRIERCGRFHVPGAACSPPPHRTVGRTSQVPRSRRGSSSERRPTATRPRAGRSRPRPPGFVIESAHSTLSDTPARPPPTRGRRPASGPSSGRSPAWSRSCGASMALRPPLDGSDRPSHRRVTSLALATGPSTGG